jgi:hypothetical protein
VQPQRFAVPLALPFDERVERTEPRGPSFAAEEWRTHRTDQVVKNRGARSVDREIPESSINIA